MSDWKLKAIMLREQREQARSEACARGQQRRWEREPSPAYLQSARLQVAINRTLAGESQRAVARELGVSPATVCRALERARRRREYAAPPPRVSREPLLHGERLEEAARLYRLPGATLRWVAEQLGVCRDTVRRALKRAGYVGAGKRTLTYDGRLRRDSDRLMGGDRAP